MLTSVNLDLKDTEDPQLIEAMDWINYLISSGRCRNGIHAVLTGLRTIDGFDQWRTRYCKQPESHVPYRQRKKK